jgi:hypothetical protein
MSEAIHENNEKMYYVASDMLTLYDDDDDYDDHGV